ncbi:hypothetical protein K1719_045070 [Acacia pycnantha]|nr:hypothetical protein K1719_045070 [Acacia pycnantha]
MAKSASKTQNSEEEVILGDVISDLPNSLIHYIFFFLSTKEASSIILLSKRWNSLWLSQPTLDFNDEEFSSLHSFTHFVNSVLNILKDSSEPITNFRIKCSGNSLTRPTNKFEAWVKAVLNLGVQHLELCFPDWYVVNLPSSVFVCSTIRLLKLHGSIRVGNVSFVDLSSLKVLHLEDDVQFPCFKCVSKILSGCVQLESLVLNRISSGDYDQNIEMLQNLTLLDDDHVVPSRLTTYEIPTFNNLSRLEISMDESSTLLDVPECVLSISHLEEVYVRNFFGSEGEFQFAKLIMKNANSLKTFSIGLDFIYSATLKEELRKRPPYAVPLPHLRCSSNPVRASQTYPGHCQRFSWFPYVCAVWSNLKTWAASGLFLGILNGVILLEKMMSEELIACRDMSSENSFMVSEVDFLLRGGETTMVQHSTSLTLMSRFIF